MKVQFTRKPGEYTDVEKRIFAINAKIERHYMEVKRDILIGSDRRFNYKHTIKEHLKAKYAEYIETLWKELEVNTDLGYDDVINYLYDKYVALNDLEKTIENKKKVRLERYPVIFLAREIIESTKVHSLDNLAKVNINNRFDKNCTKVKVNLGIAKRNLFKYKYGEDEAKREVFNEEVESIINSVIEKDEFSIRDIFCEEDKISYLIDKYYDLVDANSMIFDDSNRDNYIISTIKILGVADKLIEFWEAEKSDK